MKEVPRSENGASVRKQEEARAENARAGPAVRSARLSEAGFIRPRRSPETARVPENLKDRS